jgi:hypothetical protein
VVVEIPGAAAAAAPAVQPSPPPPPPPSPPPPVPPPPSTNDAFCNPYKVRQPAMLPAAGQQCSVLQAVQ